MQSVQTAGSTGTLSPPANSAGEDGDTAGFMSALGASGVPAIMNRTTLPTAATLSSGGSAGTASEAAIDGSTFRSSPKDLNKLAPLVQGLPADQQAAAEKALNRPLVAARMLKDGTPQEKQAAQSYFDANPALKQALDTSAHGGKADGAISGHDLSAFISKMSKQQGRAENTVNQYLKANPNADAQSTQLVRQSALLQAYMPVLQANSVDKNGKAGKDMTQSGLQAVLGDSGLSSALRGAASTFSQPGMFHLLDQGGKEGVSLATHNADGKIDENNITDWVSKQAPTTGGQFASTISDAATRNAVANIDTSGLGADVFQNPQNYSGAQKAAVLVQLQDTQAQLQAGSSLKHNNKTNTAIGDDIAQLSNDPDVQDYLAQAVPAGEKQIVGSDASLRHAVTSTYNNDVQTGAMLQGELRAVSQNNADSKNAIETDGTAVSDFAAQTRLDSDLSDGQTGTVQQIVGGNAALTNTLQNDYRRDFSQGGELSQLQGVKKADLGTSLQTTQQDKQSLGSVLDPDFVQSQATQYSEATMQQALADGGSGKAVVSALKSGGDASLSDIARSIAEMDPSQLYGGSGTGLGASDTHAVVSSFLNDLSHGSSVQDAAARFDPDSAQFDPKAADPSTMNTLRNDPAAAQAVQAMLQTLAAAALGLSGPSDTSAPGSMDPGMDPSTGQAAVTDATDAASAAGTAQAGPSGSEKAQQGLMYAGLGLGVGSAATIPANAINNHYWNNRGNASGSVEGQQAANDAKAANTARISMAGEAAGGIGGVFGAATMLPGVAQQIRDGQGAEAALSIGAGARGIVQGGALALNTGTALARSSQAIRQVGTLGVTQAARQIGTSWTGDALGKAAGSAAGRVAGQVAGRVAGTAAAEAIGAAAGPVGWVVDAALGIGFIFEAIAAAVKKAHERKEMSHTVDPTLKQYGIPTV